jgi:3-keto-5-aminohexanoate cleavage enzyme
MKKRVIKPELESYHPGCAWVVDYLIEQKLLDPPYWIQTVMGVQTASWPTIDNLLQLLRDLPDETLWLCSGIGPAQLPMTTLAILLGGHVRVGLEDNIYYRRGEKATSNAQLVERAVRLTHELNREVATPQQAREILGMVQKRAQPMEAKSSRESA